MPSSVNPYTGQCKFCSKSVTGGVMIDGELTMVCDKHRDKGDN